MLFLLWSTFIIFSDLKSTFLVEKIHQTLVFYFYQSLATFFIYNEV